jgi:hypothetical protein
MVVVLYLALFLGPSSRAALWSPYTPGVDEIIQLYEGGRNFAQRGFAVHWFLPDLSTSSSALYQPHLYNHQPPGPQLAIGILIRLLGEDYWLIRSVFATMFLLGLICYAGVAGLVLKPYTRWAELAVVLIAPLTVLRLIDHPVYSLFPLFAFLPVLALYRYRATGRWWWMAAAAVVVFVASNYLIYAPFFLVLAWLALGWALKLIPIKLRDLLLLLGVTVLGIVVHLLQTVLVLGWSMFMREISVTLSNRAVGIPTHDDLRDFYDEIGFLLFGGHLLSLAGFQRAVRLALWFPGRSVAVATLLIAVGVSLVAEISRIRAGRRSISPEFVRWVTRLATVAVWIGAAVLTPLAMFPAFATDSGLAGTSEFLMALFVVFAIGTAFRFLQAAPYAAWTKRVVSGLLAIATVWIVIVQARAFADVSIVSDRAAGRAERDGFRWIADHLSGEVVMTNVDPILVGFFTREAAYGGCHRRSLLSGTIDVKACFVRSFRLNKSAGLPVPRAFVWYVRGQSFCANAAECISREEIAKRYATLFENGLLAVFDLTAVKS